MNINDVMRIYPHVEKFKPATTGIKYDEGKPLECRKLLALGKEPIEIAKKLDVTVDCIYKWRRKIKENSHDNI